ncbi:sporulation protein YqfD [Thermoactinomyces mirandus]|uniref:Sporulation protein YqfD n=1 Tax=Thermoactinomyces mirandus TaxID=2756294 RepID=A0A7W2APB3_9BACL|nr:sporulation protein YqfD [Thermoactinomyces mirandus]MBA4600754.1 sporulation protein YqfD [Thermoactinomyces mirandus]
MPFNMLPTVLKGKMECTCEGKQLTPLINQAVQTGITIEDIEWLDEHRIRLSIPLSQFFSFYKLMRQAGNRVRITKREGFPFLWKRIKKRKFFVLGFILFFILILLFTSFVWNVKIEGTEKIPSRHVQAMLKKQGIYPGQWKMRLPEREEVQHQLLSQLPQASWVGYRVEGTRVVVTVVEKKLAEPDSDAVPDAGPVHLVATKNALIYDMQIERGYPLVEVNDVVQKGQTLVSGIYGDVEDSKSRRIVGAKGKVWGEVWYESSVVIPLERKRKVYTGERDRAQYPYLFSYVVKNPFVKEPALKNVDVIEHFHFLKLAEWTLPLGWVVVEKLEAEWMAEKLTVNQAVQEGLVHAKEDLLQKIGLDGRILGEKVLQKRLENGKVYLKVHFDVIENIARIQPILQGE